MFGRSVCGELASAERREWLVTNGLGGFASGTIAGSLTRRYHGLLFAAIEPPAVRRLLVTKFDETAIYAGRTYALTTNRWRGGVVDPAGANIERFELDGTTPVWLFACADALLEKRIWMEHGKNVTYVRYAHVRGSEPLALSIRVLVNARDLHATTHEGALQIAALPIPGGLRIDAAGNAPFFVVAERGTFALENVWYRDFELAAEAERGLDDLEDHLCAATFAIVLAPGAAFALVASDAPLGALDVAGAQRRRRARDAALLDAWQRAQPEAAAAPAWLRRCVLAADQFVVSRPLRDDAAGVSVIAGYPWFTDWGRDTAIALPGLTLTTGRAEIAAKILTTFAAFVDGGMLPNVFPSTGDPPEYNTVDAALWYVEAVAAYVTATDDRVLLARVFPALESIVAAYRVGTRFGIRVDPADGLVHAGAPGVQLTWMDAKVGDWVVTPRIGKPVEIAALWYNALERLVALAPLVGRDAEPYALAASATRGGFDRFWDERLGYCKDVLDGPDGDDRALRPNQLFAVSLRHSPLDRARQRALVERCGREFLASTGLRSLSPADPRYVGRYTGGPLARDGAYHQGTAWLWLLGPYAIAYARAYGDSAGARRLLDAYADAVCDGGLGTLGELADGDPPFRARGAIAQAWSVAEALRAWHDAPRFAALEP